MANPYHHALSSVKKWGGETKDYQKIHDWFDASKEFHGDFRHRALRHHAQGIFECERLFGKAAIKIGAQLYLKRFYGELGWEQAGEMYYEDAIEHIPMIRK